MGKESGSTLENSGVLDLVSLSPSGDHVILRLVATEPWDPSGDGTLKLQAKLKNYVVFAADGQLAQHYPDTVGKKVLIRIDTEYPLGELEQRLVDAARQEWCDPVGIDLVVDTHATG